MNKKSVEDNKKKCITKCNNKGDIILHPFTLTYKIDVNDKKCYTKTLYNKTDDKIDDNMFCENNENKNLDIYSFGIEFSNEVILRYCFDIKSLNEGIKWIYENKINNNKFPKNYIERIANLIWETYITNQIISHDFIKMYHDFFDKKYNFDAINDVIIKVYSESLEKKEYKLYNYHRKMIKYIKK